MIRSQLAPHIVEVVAELQDAGYETYVVGGAVRDLLLEREPKDYDLSTSATPEQIRSVFRRRRCHIIGRRFRLVHLYHGREIIEISTFRTEPSKNQVHPKGLDSPENMIFHDNEFGTAEEDAWRRDFTVNAIFYDPVADQIVDFTGMGMQGFEGGMVRAIGDAEIRFQEDPVRMLRALKLVGQYGFVLEAETAKALEDSLPLIGHVSPSRLGLELEKILKNCYSHRILQAFYEAGFLLYYLPFLHSKWESEAGQYAIELLKTRNERVSLGIYRDSISLAIAILSLPFVEERFNGCVGESWDNVSGIEPDLRKIALNVISPHNTTKRLLASTVRTLLLQPRLRQKRRPGKVMVHPGYPHAREAIIIQNETCWHEDGLEEFWPIGRSRPKPTKRRKKKSKRRHPDSDIQT